MCFVFVVYGRSEKQNSHLFTLFSGMACLLAELEDHPKQVSQECRKLLDKRKQLWELAAQVCLPVEIKTRKEIYAINFQFQKLSMKECNMNMHTWVEYFKSYSIESRKVFALLYFYMYLNRDIEFYLTIKICSIFKLTFISCVR